MDWKKIRAEYVAGGTSYRKLAEKHNVTLAALRHVAQKENWVELKAQVQLKTRAKVVEAISNREAAQATSIDKVADALIKRIEAMVADDEAVFSATGIKDLATAIKTLREVKGIKSEDDKREQDARIKALRARVKADEADEEGTGVVQLPEVMPPPVEASDG